MPAALEHLEQALVNALQQGFYVVHAYALSILALMYAEAGEIEQALELYTTVTTHPWAANSRWFDDLFGRRLAELSTGLPAETIAAAQGRGRGRSLSAAGQEALDRLRASPGLREDLLTQLRK